MKRSRVIALSLAMLVIVGTVVLAVGPGADARHSPKIRRSLGIVELGTGGIFTVDASNLTGKAESVTVYFESSLFFSSPTSVTQTVPADGSKAFVFDCASGAFCGGLLVARSSPRIVLDAYWTFNTVRYFARPGDWAKV